MTRINAGIHPTQLCRECLIAEHREITRVPNAVTSGKAKFDGIPDTFRLGAGHVKFFYVRLGYLYRRYTALLTECRRRGYDVTDKSGAWEGTTPGLAYTPSWMDRMKVVRRIEENGMRLIDPEPGQPHPGLF